MFDRFVTLACVSPIWRRGIGMAFAQERRGQKWAGPNAPSRRAGKDEEELVVSVAVWRTARLNCCTRVAPGARWLLKRASTLKPHFGGDGMRTVVRKTELSPLEAIVVEGTLGAEARKNAQNGTLARIQQLTRERQKLYARSVGRPMLGPANAARIRAISVEIELLWEL